MTDFLKEASARASRPSLVQALMTRTNAKWDEDARFMTDLGTRSECLSHVFLHFLIAIMFPTLVLEERKHNPIEKKDLLNIMLYSKDPKTGEGLPDDAIMKNVRVSCAVP